MKSKLVLIVDKNLMKYLVLVKLVGLFWFELRVNKIEFNVKRIM